jgi:hypothetical protein
VQSLNPVPGDWVGRDRALVDVRVLSEPEVVAASSFSETVLTQLLRAPATTVSASLSSST